CVARRRGKLIDKAAEIDSRHGARLLCGSRRLETGLDDNRLGQSSRARRYSKTIESSAAVRGFHVDYFRMGHFFGYDQGHQPCKNSMEKTAFNLDFCASRCSLLQCGSESYRCPPWAFPP